MVGVVGTGGFEPPTCRLGGDRSIQLSYVPTLFSIVAFEALAANVRAVVHAFEADLPHARVGAVDRVRRSTPPAVTPSTRPPAVSSPSRPCRVPAWNTVAPAASAASMPAMGFPAWYRPGYPPEAITTHTLGPARHSIFAEARFPSAAAISPAAKSRPMRCISGWVSGSPIRTLNSSTLGPLPSSSGRRRENP